VVTVTEAMVVVAVAEEVVVVVVTGEVLVVVVGAVVVVVVVVVKLHKPHESYRYTTPDDESKPGAPAASANGRYDIPVPRFSALPAWVRLTPV
jgi:hypothetical protein